MSEPKITRRRGRPRIHPRGTEVVSLRAPAGIGVLLRGVIARIRLCNQQLDDSDATIILGALKLRLKSLENRDPRSTMAAIAAIDKWPERE